ncbi:uncharacterized protein LOC118272126 [Spodoptera frugiperda]|uniref:Uncharacterized protein LOC118272126 n=1 Tax=Spodoptera frugiperda TaxID=7108 RepID=A0A9R0EMQ7_SPOFR|nr:uncharacterized protein LOC118272126 [Spodoptera frugiperda]
MKKKTKYNFLYILIISSVANGDTDLIFPEDREKGTVNFNSITDCIITITEMELYFRPTVAILDQDGNTTENIFKNELIDKLTAYNIPQVIIKDVVTEENYDLYLICLTVAFFDSCADIKNFDFKSIDKEMRFLIIISDYSGNNCVDTLEEIGDSVSKHAITFIIQDFVTGQNNMYTIFPKIDEKTCKEVVEKPTHINTCFNNGTVQNEEIFPIKNPNNLNRCPFRIGMATLFPFSEIPNKELLKNYDNVTEIKGFDYEILKIIAEYFNATLETHYIYRKEENPYKDLEFTDFIKNGSLDACAGGLYRIYGDLVEYSGVYVRQGVFWVYYAERAERSWQNLVSKLDDVYFFIIFYITYSIVWCLVSSFDGQAVSLITTLIHGWGALVGATSLQDPRTKKQKFLNLLYLIMSVYSSVYVSIQFYSFLTVRGPPQMFKTNSAVMESGRTAYLKNSSKYFITDERYTKYADHSADCVSFYNCAEKTLMYNGLTLLLQANFYIFQADSAVNDEARVLRATENMLTVYNEMLIRKDSPLVAKFQKVMKRLFEAGITGRLFTEAIGISVVAKAESANSNMITSSYSCQAGCSITLMQFAGIFYAWIFGCVISCLVFVIEILSRRVKVKEV